MIRAVLGGQHGPEEKLLAAAAATYGRFLSVGLSPDAQVGHLLIDSLGNGSRAVRAAARHALGFCVYSTALPSDLTTLPRVALFELAALVEESPPENALAILRKLVEGGDKWVARRAETSAHALGFELGY